MSVGVWLRVSKTQLAGICSCFLCHSDTAVNSWNAAVLLMILLDSRRQSSQKSVVCKSTLTGTVHSEKEEKKSTHARSRLPVRLARRAVGNLFTAQLHPAHRQTGSHAGSCQKRFPTPVDSSVLRFGSVEGRRRNSLSESPVCCRMLRLTVPEVTPIYCETD